METKNSIRKEKLSLRNGMDMTDRLQKSKRIVQSVLALPSLQEAEHILCYASYQSEVETIELIQKLLAQEKHVYLPRVNEGEMDFYQITGKDDLISGYKGILEPSFSCTKIYEAENHANAVMLMPGAAFSKDGSRIGYGKGYYDRYLDKYDIMNRIALCFSLQMTEYIPNDMHDKKASVIVTEDEVIHCKK